MKEVPLNRTIKALWNGLRAGFRPLGGDISLLAPKIGI
jgi:hypothetical protein